MNSIIGTFKKDISNHLVFDSVFLEEKIIDFKRQLESSLTTIDSSNLKDMMIDLEYNISEFSSSHLLVERNNKKILFIINDYHIHNTHKVTVLQANKINIAKIVYDYLLNFLCNKYDTIWSNPSMYQHIHQIIYNNS